MTKKEMIAAIQLQEAELFLQAKRYELAYGRQDSLCISCFKRCYYGDENIEGKPIFPYPDIEDEYDDDTENIKWVNDYPLIKIYNEELNKWDDEKTEKYENEKNLRICSICRK